MVFCRYCRTKGRGDSRVTVFNVPSKKEMAYGSIKSLLFSGRVVSNARNKAMYCAVRLALSSFINHFPLAIWDVEYTWNSVQLLLSRRKITGKWYEFRPLIKDNGYVSNKQWGKYGKMKR